MKSIKFILAISFILINLTIKIKACGPYYPENPSHIYMFRSCSPELERQWQEGCRFQDYEKYENCLLWQKLTSDEIPLKDIEIVVYDSKLNDIRNLPEGKLSSNQFARWLTSATHKEDLEYILVAKEIEEIREYMNDPWYYPYNGDEEHKRLDELVKICQNYDGRRHADRYALQTMRLYFAQKDFQSCIDLWESVGCKLPQNIVTDMMASYAGGAYSRKEKKGKAIEIYTRSQDIGSLINLKAWDNSEEKSVYKDSRVRELEYIFNRFPNSPLLCVKLQEHIRNRENFVYGYADWKDRDFHDPVGVKFYWEGDSLIPDDEQGFYDELKRFAKTAISTKSCQQKGMWLYGLAYLNYLDGDTNNASTMLRKAESSENSPFIQESVRAFSMFLHATKASNTSKYLRRLSDDLQWLDECMKRDANKDIGLNWFNTNKLNYSFYYWQDVARKVLLGELCPRLENEGNTVLALQLANYASNRLHQLKPLYEAYHFGWRDEEDPESYHILMPFEEYRRNWKDHNWFDYSNQFFDMINGVKASEAAKYAETILNPKTDLDRFLNERGYVDTDYIFDIVGTLYLREMNYEKADEWLSKVSSEYQARTNIAKEGYFKLDPFRYQADKKLYIKNSNDYKLRFAKQMDQLEKTIASTIDPNIKANAKLRYAIGLRNSFGKCWYLTEYGYSVENYTEWEDVKWQINNSDSRAGFKKNIFAQEAYRKVDELTAEAISEFTDPEQGAQAQLEMMNYATLMKKYPQTKAAAKIRGRCDNYYDYALQKR